MTETERIAKAIEIALEAGFVDGSHHKQWGLDQVIRILTDCPLVTESATDEGGQPYTYETYGENDAYRAAINDDADPEEYTPWEEGSAW